MWATIARNNKYIYVYLSVGLHLLYLNLRVYIQLFEESRTETNEYSCNSSYKYVQNHLVPLFKDEINNNICPQMKLI